MKVFLVVVWDNKGLIPHNEAGWKRFQTGNGWEAYGFERKIWHLSYKCAIHFCLVFQVLTICHTNGNMTLLASFIFEIHVIGTHYFAGTARILAPYTGELPCKFSGFF
jgi:hypothetical protein